jgi:transcriptional regulator with XRE-family HTH domain
MATTKLHFAPINHIQKTEMVDFIVPERIREAVEYRGYSYEEAAKKCGISRVEFGLMTNGHKEIPKEMIFKLMKGLDFPKGFFYRVEWERV